MSIQSLYTNTSAMASRRYIGINSDRLSIYQEQLSTGSRVADPSRDPSASAIGYLLDSTLQILEQAVMNSNQASAMVQLATGALGSTNAILTRMTALAAQVNSDSIGSAQRGLLDKEYQTLLNQIDENAKITWAGTQLFTGGTGAISQLGTQTQSINGTQAGTIITGLDNTSRGFISGNVENVTVSNNSHNLLNVSMVVGGQTFQTNTSGIVAGTPSTVNLTLTPDTGSTTPPVGISYTNSTTNSFTATQIQTLIGSYYTSGNTSGTDTVATSFSVAAGTTTITGTGAYAGVVVTITGASSPTAVTAFGLANSNASLVYTAGGIIYTSNAAALGAATTTQTGKLTLISINDSSNQIVLNYSNSTVNAYNTATTLQTLLKNYLGLNVGAPAAFQSTGSDYPIGTGGIVNVPSNNVLYQAGSAMSAGVWGLSLVKNTVGIPGYYFQLTDGVSKFTSEVLSSAITSDPNTGDTYISGNFYFDNGFSINLPIISGYDFGGLKTTQAGSMALINVGSGTSLIRSFQIGQSHDEIISVQFNNTTVASLHLAGTNITNKENAIIAAGALTAAMSAVDQSIAELGGVRAQLDAINKNLELSVQNQTEARATFTDTDIPDALINSQKYTALMQTSSSMLQSTLQRYRELSELVRSVNR